MRKMDAKEAIKLLEVVDKLIDSCPSQLEDEENTLNDFGNAMMLASEALEKQVAKEVTNKFTDLNEEGFEVEFGGCPNCKMEVNFDDNEYCPYCGQRLDWSSDKE